ncbi:uncharacterized protein N0V89_004464 [Didymosphaeria variabile]|uniref:Uncharacterized protein n=1 Tax=Didymosphaeria variabile TaxID=1932322 RepID=A0A9W8XR84_9PLEO|nr:uncharacterized protein N0V89_004464 [Didymosphaeria variabile]KAJ4356431.1 hypothetical protein N0V89_004464 [Didymosphaeria variabile]
MRLQFVFLTVTTFMLIGTHLAETVRKINITTLVSVGSRTSSDHVDPQDKRDSDASSTETDDCSAQIVPISCFAVTKSSASSAASSRTSSTISSTSSTPSTTVATPTNSTSTTSSAASTTTNSADHPRDCFEAGKVCADMFGNITTLWNVLPANVPPSSLDKNFTNIFCDPIRREEREEVQMVHCRACSDVDSSTHDIWDSFEKTVKGFCTAPSPSSVYVLSKKLLAFAKDLVIDPLGVQPEGFDPVVEFMVTEWEWLGANKTTSTDTATTTGGGGGGGATAVPTKGLSQLPNNWPYTRAAVARRPGQTATFTVTKEGGEAEFVVVEEMLW